MDTNEAASRPSGRLTGLFPFEIYGYGESFFGQLVFFLAIVSQIVYFLVLVPRKALFAVERKNEDCLY